MGLLALLVHLLWTEDFNIESVAFNLAMEAIPKDHHRKFSCTGTLSKSLVHFTTTSVDLSRFLDPSLVSEGSFLSLLPSSELIAKWGSPPCWEGVHNLFLPGYVIVAFHNELKQTALPERRTNWPPHKTASA